MRGIILFGRRFVSWVLILLMMATFFLPFFYVFQNFNVEQYHSRFHTYFGCIISGFCVLVSFGMIISPLLYALGTKEDFADFCKEGEFNAEDVTAMELGGICSLAMLWFLSKICLTLPITCYDGPNASFNMTVLPPIVVFVGFGIGRVISSIIFAIFSFGQTGSK